MISKNLRIIPRYRISSKTGPINTCVDIAIMYMIKDCSDNVSIPKSVACIFAESFEMIFVVLSSKTINIFAINIYTYVLPRFSDLILSVDNIRL